MNIDNKIIRIENEILGSSCSIFITMFHSKLDAVKAANYFRNPKNYGHYCIVETVGYMGMAFFRLTIKKVAG